MAGSPTQAATSPAPSINTSAASNASGSQEVGHLLDNMARLANGLQQRASVRRSLHEPSPAPSSALSSDTGSRGATVRQLVQNYQRGSAAPGPWKSPERHYAGSLPFSGPQSRGERAQEIPDAVETAVPVLNYNERSFARVAATARSTPPPPPPHPASASRGEAAAEAPIGQRGAAHRRLAAWAQMREETLEQLRQERERLDSLQMPFQPHINRAPQHASSAPRSRASSHHSDARRDEASGTISFSGPSKEGGPDATSHLHARDDSEVHGSSTKVQDRLLAVQEVAEANLRHLRDVKYRDRELTFHPQVAYHPIHDRQRSVVERSTVSQRARGVSDTPSTLGITSSSTQLPSAIASPRALGEGHLTRVEREELAECTFQPSIGPHSRRVYTTSRIEEGQMDVFTRLYSRSSAAVNARGQQQGNAVSESRLDHSFQAQRQQLLPPPIPPIPAPLQEELSALRSYCNTVNDESDPFGSFLCNVLGASSPTALPPTVDFGSHFLCRLTSEYVDDSIFSNAAQNAHNGQSSEAAEKSTAASKGAASTTMMVNFDDFLRRQVEREQRRRQHHESLVRELAPQLHPNICEESRRIVQQRTNQAEGSGSPSYASPAGRSGSSARRAKKKSMFEEPTFKPTISALAETFPRRGVDRMHRYGQQYNAHKEQLRQQKLALEAEASTFRPATNKNFKHVSSMLNPQSLQAYKEHLVKTREAHIQRKELHDALKENQEHEQCTFRPKIGRTPSYISMMAQSFSAVRQAQLELSSQFGFSSVESPRWVN